MREIVLDEELLCPHIGVVEEKVAKGRLAVTPRAADLLVVGLDGAGDVPVDDEADVGTVHAHAEGVCRDDNGTW